MSRYTKKLFSFGLLSVAVSLFLVIQLMAFKVHAGDITTVDPSQYQSTINSYVGTSEYYVDMSDVIEKYYPKMNLLPTQYEEVVKGKQNYKVLEITPRSYIGDPVTEVSDLSTNVNQLKNIYKELVINHSITNKYFIQNMTNFEVEVMTIKEFVSNREDLKGKYDAIVFAGGYYDPSQVRSDCDINVEDCSDILNTKEILNDITTNKALDIMTYYVQENLPVFIHEDVFYHTNTNLYTTFFGLDVQYDNVFILNEDVVNKNNNISFYNTLAIMQITELLSTKPFINITNKPVDYMDNSSFTYTKGDMLDFNFELTNKETSELKFYIDVNQDEKYQAEELAYKTIIQKGNNNFSFQLPELYSGLLKYQIILDDHDFQLSGTIRYKGEMKEIKVLNIVSDMVYSKNSLYDNTLKSLYFENNGDYNITVNSCTVKDFSKNNVKFPCSHNVVMDNYDVILLGQDIFDKPLNTHVYNSIQSRIDQGKPFIFTSSITKGNENWISYFSDELKLSNHKTNMNDLNYNVNKLQIINDSYYVSYPYNMNHEELVVPEDLNYAFNEMYQLDLESQELVPLMNMYNSLEYRLDRFDSYNNFYYLKQDKIVYLNIGNNAFKTFTEMEHKLLVDTIVNLYIHKQSENAKIDFYISANNTFANDLIDVKDPVTFNFNVFSNKVEQFNYVLKVNERIVETSVIDAGAQINVNLIELIKATDMKEAIEEVYISINITNDKDETRAYGFYIYVGNFVNYHITQTTARKLTPVIKVDQTQYVEVNKSDKYKLEYNFTLNSIDVSYLDTINLPQTFEINNVKYEEVLPEGVSVNSTSTDILVNGQTVSHNIGAITYTLTNQKYVPSITEYKISIPITITKVGSMSLDQSKLIISGINSDYDEINLGTINFFASSFLTEDKVVQNFEEYIFIPKGEFIEDLTKKFTISHEVGIKEVKFELIDKGSSPFTLEGNRLTSIGIGEQDIRITVIDIYDNTVTRLFHAMTYEPITSLTLKPLSMFIDESKALDLMINPTVSLDNIKYRLIKNESLNNSAVVEIVVDNNQIIARPLNKGYAEIEVYGYDVFGNKVSVTNSILVNERTDIQFVDNYVALLIGNTYTYQEMVENVRILTGYNYSDITWSSSDPTVATVTNGEITALKEGTVRIEALSPNGYSAIMIVKVLDKLTSDSGFIPTLNNMKVYAGYEQNLLNFLELYPSYLVPSDLEITFTVTDSQGILAFYNEATHTFNTTTHGTLNLTVTITQYDHHGQYVASANDSFTLTVYEVPITGIDRVTNKH